MGNILLISWISTVYYNHESYRGSASTKHHQLRIFGKHFRLEPDHFPIRRLQFEFNVITITVQSSSAPPRSGQIAQSKYLTYLSWEKIQNIVHMSFILTNTVGLQTDKPSLSLLMQIYRYIYVRITFISFISILSLFYLITK